ncbi:MAG: 30S ribosomal protein S20 [Planctomycetota bacterium]|nr:MAG: 30S ribosomal protein S20 [Planctomycetota bacterium]
MPNTQSAKKEQKKSLVRRERNRARKSSMRTWIKRTMAAVEAQDLETAEKSLTEAVKLIDKNAKWSQIHANTAARRKSRLMRAVNSIR